MTDPYYLTKAWRRLRAARWEQKREAGTGRRYWAKGCDASDAM